MEKLKAELSANFKMTLPELTAIIVNNINTICEGDKCSATKLPHPPLTKPADAPSPPLQNLNFSK